MFVTRLGSAEHAFLGAARRAILGTIDPAGLPHLVPICFVVAEDPDGGHRLLTPIDDKPKIAADPLALARVRDIRARPDVTVLVERWDEDWSRLAWLRLTGRATILEPDALPVEAIAALRFKYPQYASHRLEDRPSISITIERARSWGVLDQD
jgi:PPOX class probable F420-dependent enzyme